MICSASCAVLAAQLCSRTAHASAQTPQPNAHDAHVCCCKVHVSTNAACLHRSLKHQRLVSDRAADAPLFLTQQRSSFSANTMCQLFLNIYSDFGFKGASSHSGRRTFITKLANTGINVRLLAALAGHRHISTTQRYIDVNDAQLAQAVDLI